MQLQSWIRVLRVRHAERRGTAPSAQLLGSEARQGAHHERGVQAEHGYLLHTRNGTVQRRLACGHLPHHSRESHKRSRRRGVAIGGKDLLMREIKKPFDINFSNLKILLLILLFTGCDGTEVVPETRIEPQPRINRQERAETGFNLSNAVADVTSQMDQMAIAVPGERWLRLVDAVGGDDELKREEARRYIKRLFSVDLEEEYEISITFSYKPADTPIEVDVFFDLVPGEAAVKRYCASQFTWSPKAVGTLGSALRTNEALEAEVGAAVRGAIDILGGNTKDRARGPDSEVEIQDEGRRQAATEQLTSAILKFYESEQLPAGEATITRPFSMASNTPLLYILVREEHLGAHPDLSVEAVVHKKGNVEETFNSQWPVKLESRHFSAKPVACGVSKDKIQWTAHNMTDTPVLTEVLLNDIERLDRIMYKWERRESDGE